MADDGDVGVAGGLDVAVLNGGGDETGVVGDDFELNLLTDLVVALDVQSVAKGTGVLSRGFGILTSDLEVITDLSVAKRILALEGQLFGSINAYLLLKIRFNYLKTSFTGIPSTVFFSQLAEPRVLVRTR